MNAVVTDYLFLKFPQTHQGILTDLAKPLKCREGAVLYAHEVGISQICCLGKSVREQDLQGDLLGEMFEALMGAIYLSSDRNFSVTRDWFQSRCITVIEQQIQKTQRSV
jgi:dsRNA-specific ribonuclease